MKKVLLSILISFSIIVSFCYSMNLTRPINTSLNMDQVESDSLFCDVVPDEETAKKIAETIWIPIYGEELILMQRPYQAVLENGIWIVKGIFPNDPNMRGGVAYIEIQKRDCKILKIAHSR